jgi:hypothetical protein
LNRDFVEMLAALSAADAECPLAGTHSLPLLGCEDVLAKKKAADQPKNLPT